MNFNCFQWHLASSARFTNAFIRVPKLRNNFAKGWFLTFATVLTHAHTNHYTILGTDTAHDYWCIIVIIIDTILIVNYKIQLINTPRCITLSSSFRKWSALSICSNKTHCMISFFNKLMFDWPLVKQLNSVNLKFF